MRSGAGANQAAAGYLRKKAERRRLCKYVALCFHNDLLICDGFASGAVREKAQRRFTGSAG